MKYEDGSEVGYQLGRIFGNAAGLTIPHEVVTPLKLGDTFDVGEAIVYNDGFFEPDFFDARRVVLKMSMTAKVCLWESAQTLEDASMISQRFAEKMVTKTSKQKNIILNFDQTVSKLVKVGAKVEADTVLCLIEDAITASSNLFDEESIDTLKALSSQSPKAHVKGVVERIEVYYHGDLEDMSASLREIAMVSNKQFKEEAIAVNKTAYTGSVDASFRIENEPLALDSLAIRIYITMDNSCGVGDKGVFSHQLKTVFSEVMHEQYRTERGVDIDAVFGMKSVDDRIVTSATLNGMATTLLNVIAEKAVDMYFN